VRDLLEAMTKDARRPLTRLRVDGGAAKNDLLMQFQADVADVVAERPSDVESTGRGAAMLAGVGAGLCKGLADAERMLSIEARFEPAMSARDRSAHLARWADALARTRTLKP